MIDFKTLKAGAEADFAFKIGFDAIRTGVTERSIAGQIDYQLKIQKGVMHESFETIVQAGKNAANPHFCYTNTRKLFIDQFLQLNKALFIIPGYFIMAQTKELGTFPD